METYEEKYKKALEKAKSMMTLPTDKAMIEEIFPELAEPDDEKIRKQLLEMVHDTTGDSLWIDYDVHKEDMLAWLEKQGEHSNFLSKIQVGDKVTRNEDGVLVNLSQLKRIAKPAEEHNITGIGSKSAQGKLGEMIKNLKPVNEVLEQGFAWSEEDEKQARQIERIVHDDGCTQKLQKQIANWLKSLKDRYTWKPSDEQMNTLEYYMHTLVCNEHKEILFGLYSCLKKLREE